MGHALIWVETLAAALLAVSLVTAVAAGRSNRWSRWLTAGLFAFGVFAAALVGTLVLGLMARSGMVVPGKVWFAGTWTVAFAVGALFILSRGLRPNTEGVPPARSWPRGRLAAGVAAALVLDAITVTNLDLALKVQLAAERAEAGAKLTSLIPPQVSDRDNAAIVYQQAFAALPTDEPTFHKLSLWLHPKATFDPRNPEVVALLQNRGPGLDLLRRAAALPACRFERDYFQSGGPASLEPGPLMTASGMLALDARVRADRGETRAALADVAALFAMARHTEEPGVVMLMTSIALERRATQTLEGVLNRTTPGAADLAAARPVDAPFQRAFRQAFQLESAASLTAFLTYPVGEFGEHCWWLVPEGGANAAVRFFESPIYRVFFLADDLAAYRRREQVTQVLTWQPPYQYARSKWEDADALSYIGLWPWGLNFSTWKHIAAEVASAEASHRLAQLALAAEAYRIKTGKFPEQLDALVPDYLPAIPTDPCSGTPLRAKRDGKTLILYSVGPDGIDDGGVASVKRSGAGDQGDVAFRLTDR